MGGVVTRNIFCDFIMPGTIWCPVCLVGGSKLQPPDMTANYLYFILGKSSRWGKTRALESRISRAVTYRVPVESLLCGIRFGKKDL